MIKKIFLYPFSESLYPYSMGVMVTCIVFFLNCKFNNGILPEQSKIINLANILITSVSIFIGFLGVALTLIFQSSSLDGVAVIKSHGLYKKLISYFKTPMIYGVIAIFYSIFITLSGDVNSYTLFIMLLIYLLFFLLNYRVLNLFFRIIESDS